MSVCVWVCVRVFLVWLAFLQLLKGPNPLSDIFARRRGKTYTCYESTQMLTSSSDIVRLWGKPYTCYESVQTLTSSSDIVRLWGKTHTCYESIQTLTSSSDIVRLWGKTYTCYGSIQMLTSSSDSVLCLMRRARARFLSDTTHFPTVTSESVLPYDSA